MLKMDDPVLHLYDAVASEYADRYFRELDHKPFDRLILERFARTIRTQGRVCDMGCGPGEVARFLKDRDVDAFGLDLSERMIEEAGRLNPDIEFMQGDMLHLDLRDETLAGISAFYGIVHFTEDQVKTALKEFHRVLEPGGCLLIAFHVGKETLHIEELFGKRVSADFMFFESDRIREFLVLTGFQIAESHVREPYPDVEYPSRRAYLRASKPGPSDEAAAL